MGQASGISDSEFNMWRAVFAFSLVDNFLSLEEQKLLASFKSQVAFSERQLQIISEDFKEKQDVEALYQRITASEDKKRFCVLARALVWSDGDMDIQEQEILKRVACLGKPENDGILSSTRNHPHIHDYYQQYAKAGVVGLFQVPHKLELQI